MDSGWVGEKLDWWENGRGTAQEISRCRQERNLLGEYLVAEVAGSMARLGMRGADEMICERCGHGKSHFRTSMVRFYEDRVKLVCLSAMPLIRLRRCCGVM